MYLNISLEQSLEKMWYKDVIIRNGIGDVQKSLSLRQFNN